MVTVGRTELLKMFSNLRVADVRDGMDWMMLHSHGSMSPDIRPLFRTRAVGIAKTIRYVPYTDTVPTLTPEQYSEWARWYYAEVSPYPWIAEIQEGDFCILDQYEMDAGIMGSNNSLECFGKGMRGLVTNGGIRDTDELIMQRIPVWSRFISQSMVQGRVQFDAFDIPVVVGGVLVEPGDVVVADGDGVIVVPRKVAPDVAKYAQHELLQDKVGRRKLYERLGMELDDSVR
ncbi:MAG: RraA family protein [Chloroflexi bacterium]|nr:RraA family protein [Chloroflexota bacterium]